MRDLHTSTVEAAAEHSRDLGEPLLGETPSNRTPGHTPRAATPYISSTTPGIVRKPCATCERPAVPHLGAEVGKHDDPTWTPCTAGTVVFG